MTTVRIRRGTKAAPQGVRATTTTISAVRRADTSRQSEYADEFEGSIISGAYIAPPFDVQSLKNAYERSNMLKQCVSAYITNVAMYGFEIVCKSAAITIDEDEREELQSFIDDANSEESLTTVHAKVVEDYEALGYGFVEVIRDRSRRPSILRHARASSMRLTHRHMQAIPVVYEVSRGRRTTTVTELRRFRRFVQILGGVITYFKEFGDPRKLHYQTGMYDGENGTKVTPELEATEIIHIRQNSEDSYGTPRWIPQLPSILGSREAEEVNLRYFEDNTIPPMMLTVAGGRLTTQSYNELRKVLDSGVGTDKQNRIMLVEAVPERDSLDDKGTPITLKVDKLTDARPSDALFAGYDDANQAKVRSSFRLPPVAVGLSQDVTFATANVSAFIAETQVYSVLRKVFDEVYNKRFVNHPEGLGLKTVWLQLKAPTITNPEQIVKTLTALNVMGGMTPRKAIEASSKLLQVELTQYPNVGEEGYEEWMDKPIALSLRGAAPENTQGEQSVKDTAIKDLEMSGDVSQHSPENGQQ